jgi:hypothetical protein
MFKYTILEQQRTRQCQQVKDFNIEEFNHGGRGGHGGGEKKRGIEDENPLFSSSFLLPPCSPWFLFFLFLNLLTLVSSEQ